MGVGHDNRRHRECFVVIGNHLAQHRELSLTAIGLSTHIQSLPTGAKVSIKALSERFAEGETRIASALRELEAHGYLSRSRERLPSGRVVTRTVSYNNPPAMGLDGHAPERLEQAPELVVPEPDPDPDPDPDPEPDPAPAPPPTPPATPGEYEEAADLLARLRLRDPRLLLSERDVARLAPSVAGWLERGLSPAAVSGTLAGCLPAEPIRSPAAFLAHRLTALRPPLLVERPSGPRPPDRQVHPFQTCDGCELAFRAASPGHCNACATATAA
ncbi:helix-turn-helix domain-containing protein [Streptomyces sp. NPDC046685]|uniref:helix-turn-helix domain-containing protein n=1 Tax=Streptomyces sp. NPDC046685 TaxID=3157202 RepID=UPI0033CA650D